LPVGADAFLTADGQRGRLVDVITRGEPAILVCHWTGIHFNGLELGFQILQEVARRLREHFADRIAWMKLSEIARYWAAKELTRCELAADGKSLALRAPFACPEFTVSVAKPAAAGTCTFVSKDQRQALEEVPEGQRLRPGTWQRGREATTMCLAMPRGPSSLEFA
jgi:hypothetical protein